MSDYDTEIYGEGVGMTAALGRETPSMRTAAAEARAAAGSLKEAAVSALDDARERARAAADEAKSKAQQRYGDLEAWVHQNPARALGVAAGLGVVMGLLMRGRATRVVYPVPHASEGWALRRRR